jgi:hypothetical protein
VRSECLTSGQRRRLRERAIECLAARDDLSSQVLRIELLASVRPDNTTVESAIAVAHSALRARSSRSVRRALAAAELAAGRDIESYRAQLDGIRHELSS